jgi:hypothetical protein
LKQIILVGTPLSSRYLLGTNKGKYCTLKNVLKTPGKKTTKQDSTYPNVKINIVYLIAKTIEEQAIK